MTEPKEGCVKPARGPLASAEAPAAAATAVAAPPRRQATVGKEAPDFEANAYVEGKGFDTIRLSSYRGKWIVLCFYPGDFTFV